MAKTLVQRKEKYKKEEEEQNKKWFHCWLCTFLLRHWKTEPGEYVHLKHTEWKPPTHLTGGQKLH